MTDTPGEQFYRKTTFHGPELAAHALARIRRADESASEGDWRRATHNREVAAVYAQLTYTAAMLGPLTRFTGDDEEWRDALNPDRGSA